MVEQVVERGLGDLRRAFELVEPHDGRQRLAVLAGVEVLSKPAGSRAGARAWGRALGLAGGAAGHASSPPWWPGRGRARKARAPTPSPQRIPRIQSTLAPFLRVGSLPVNGHGAQLREARAKPLGRPGVLPNVSARRILAAKGPTMTSTFEHRDPDDSHSLNDLPPGKFLGRYQITRLIGRGGMGWCTRRFTAISASGWRSRRCCPRWRPAPEARGRFLREGQAASRIRHPHVVDVTDVVAEGHQLPGDGVPGGEDLSSLIGRAGGAAPSPSGGCDAPGVRGDRGGARRGGDSPRPQAPRTSSWRAAGTAGLPQGPGLRDLEGSSSGGTARAHRHRRLLGTMFTSPPEQVGGSAGPTRRSDQYALGTILYECVTGHRAFEGDEHLRRPQSVAEGSSRRRARGARTCRCGSRRRSTAR